ncbi:MAG: fructofuranosidase/invertase [Planctomycetota bacterium]
MQPEALEVLRAVATPGGFLASPEARANYRRVWARDGVITSLAALLSGAPDLAATARATLATLAAHQDVHGRIPSNVALAADGSTRAVSFGGIACRTDAAAWFVIGAAHVAALPDAPRSCSREPRARPGLARGPGPGRHDLVYMPEGGDWADEYPLSGYALGLQLLRLWALRLDAQAFGREASAARAAALEGVLSVNHWRREEPLASRSTARPSRRCRPARPSNTGSPGGGHSG